MKKYGEDLDTTLIFVSFVSHSDIGILTRLQAGLFSAVTSAFILDVQPQLQPDTADETVALLRVLIYKIDNTTFGNDPPSHPQWSGPPHAIVQVQAILYASLAASLLSAFLAMLGKQWLNRYASTDMRGTAVERSQNRQRKLDGIFAWYFDHVMESLPLMLQVALLLLGCALSRYLWEINTTVASVVLGVTLFGIIFCLFVVVAGTTSESCPYQTPGSRALRYMGPRVLSAPSVIASAFKNAFKKSRAVRTIGMNVQWHHPRWSRGNIIPFLKDMVREFPRTLAIDVYHLGRAMTRPLVAFIRRVHGAFSTPEQGSDLQVAMLDLRCISWMLQTSLDKVIRLSILKHLVTMAVLADFDPNLVADCFNVFIGCINVSNRKVVIIHESEELAVVSAACFLRTLNHLLVIDPTSSVLADLRQRYNRIFPFGPDSKGLPFYSTMARIHDFFNRHVQWCNYRPSPQGYISLARDMAVAAELEYRKTQHRKVPRQTLRFAFHSLSLDPLPPTPVVADCLSIIATDLGCDVSSIGSATFDERCVHMSQTTTPLTLNQRTSGANFELDNSETQNNG